MKKYPVYLALLPLFFTLYHYNQLFGFLSLFNTALLFFMVLGAAAISYFLFYLFTRSRFKAAIAAFFLLLFLLYFGPWHDFIKSITGQSAITRYSVIISVTLILLAAITWYFFKKKEALLKFSGYLNILFLILCVVELGRIGINISRVNKDHNLIYPGKPICNNYTATHLPDSAKPDIYLLVFDEYSNNRVLKENWNFDNSDIDSFMLQLGFYKPVNSTANYNFTPFSISSLLNMNYIDEKTGTRADIAINRLKGIKSMTDNETICILEKEQYSIHFIAPFENNIDDIGINDEFEAFPEKYIYGLTFPGRFEKDIAWQFKTRNSFPTPEMEDSLIEERYRKKKDDVIRTINAIKQTTDSSSHRKPKFVYSHFMITHKPHMYDSAGNKLPGNDSSRYNLYNTYIQQVQYANKVIKELTAHIKQTNKKNTIIIVESDHGYREFPADKSALYFPNICFIYFPGGDYSLLYPNMSLVNEFRIVFNRFFNQRLPLQKDSTIPVRF